MRIVEIPYCSWCQGPCRWGMVCAQGRTVTQETVQDTFDRVSAAILEDCAPEATECLR